MRSPSFCSLATAFTAFIFTSLITASAAPKASEATASSGATYFLLERVRAVTDSGIVGIPVGAKLQVIGKTATGLKVKTSDDVVFDVKESQITQDSTQATATKEQAAIAEAEAKAKRDAIRAADAAKIAAKQQQVQAAMDAIPDPVAPAATSHSALGGSALDGGAKPTNVTVYKPKDAPTKGGSKTGVKTKAKLW